MMKKVIVTGADGFVGTWLLRELKKHGTEVWAVVMDESADIPGVHTVHCSMNHYSVLSKMIDDSDFDAFYHLAWAGSGGPSRANYALQLSNVNGVLKAYEAAVALKCKKFLCAGTITEKFFEETDTTVALSENMIYGCCKYAAKQLLSVMVEKHRVPCVWMRFSNIYGRGNNTGNIVSYTINELKKGHVPQFTQGLQPYDLIYVEDLVRAAYLLGNIDSAKGTFFIGSGKPRILREYLIEIARAFPDGKIALGARDEDGLVYHSEWFSIKPLQDATGYTSKFAFETAIRMTIGKEE